MRADTRALPLPEAVEHVIAKSGLIAHYQAEQEGQDRVEIAVAPGQTVTGIELLFLADEWRAISALAPADTPSCP